MLNLEKDEHRLWELAAAFAAANAGAGAACQIADELVLAFRARRQHSVGHSGPPPAGRPAPAAPPQSARQPEPTAPPVWKGPSNDPPVKAAPLPGAAAPKPSARRGKALADMSINEKLAELQRLQARFTESPTSLNPEEMQDMVVLTNDELLKRITPAHA